ncbi:MAG: autotransporter domain-containing protein, partial [Chlamydiae bacterium]|nr:autotransporter domain-containing protein [Chlamydiota bacterium]
IILGGNSLYIDSPAAGFTIASLSGDAASFVQSQPSLTIDVDPSVNATFAGEIQDYPSITSSLIKTGNGTQTLSGSNTYTGTTYIQQGILSINGSVMGDVTVNSGGTLKGNGTIGGAALIENGATLSPGNSVGTLHVGSLFLNSTSTTVIEIDAAASSSVIVAASATVDGALQIVQDPGAYTHEGSYLIVGASSLTGTFTSMNSVPGFAFSLSTLGNDIYLNYLLGIPTEGLLGNSLIVANYLNANAPPSHAFTYLAGLSGDALNQALESVSPSRNAFGTYITAQTAFSLSNLVSTHMDSFRVYGKGSSQEPLLSALTADSSDLVAAPIKSRGPKNRFSSWVAGFGEFAHQAALSQNPSFNFISGAALTGLDYRGEDRAAVGGSLGYAHTHYYEADHAGHGNINAYFTSIYGNAFAYEFYFSPAVWGVFNQTDNTRNISFPGFSSSAHAGIFSWQLIPHLEVGYDFAFSWGDIIPFTSADWALTWQRGYEEHGASPFNAKQKRNNSSMVRSETGLKFSENWEKSWGAFILKEKASYVFEKPFGTGAVNTSFVGTPSSFTVTAVNQNLNLGAVGLNFLIAVGKEKPIKVDFGYEGEFGASFWSSEKGLVNLELLL